MPRKKKFRPADPPAWLDAEARAEWSRLVEFGIVTPTAASYQHFAFYCHFFARWRAADRLVEAEGETLVTKNAKGKIVASVSNPRLAVALKYFDRLVKAAAAIGLPEDQQPTAGSDEAERSPAEIAGADRRGLEFFERIN